MINQFIENIWLFWLSKSKRLDILTNQISLIHEQIIQISFDNRSTDHFNDPLLKSFKLRFI